MAQTTWEIGSLKLRFEVVWWMALNSVRLRLVRSLLTVLTIATSAAFMMYLLTMARKGDATEQQSWYLMMGLAMVVSVAGVLNALLMSVTQRYREIGTMKCLGALDGFILLSVLLEAAILGVTGAVFGVVAGLVISALLCLADYGAAFAEHLRLGALHGKVLFVFLTAVLLTTLGAAMPAWVASRMPPMDAMRGEK